MRREEALAAAIVERVLPGTRAEYQSSQSHGECDFNLHWPTGQVELLEVTIATDEDKERVYAAIRGRSGEEMFVARGACQWDWYIIPGRSPNVKNLRRNLARYLSAIEAEGIEDFFSQTDAMDSPAVFAIMKDLGIEAGRVLPWDPPGRIGIGYPGSVGILDSQHVIDAANRELMKDDNRFKLGARVGEASHLAIVLGRHASLVEASMREGMLPTGVPSMLPEITTCWLICPVPKPNVCLVWMFSSESGWLNWGMHEVVPEPIDSDHVES